MEKGYAFLIDSKGTMISHPVKELNGINISNPGEKESDLKKVLVSNNMKLEDIQSMVKRMLSTNIGTTNFKIGTVNKTIC